MKFDDSHIRRDYIFWGVHRFLIDEPRFRVLLESLTHLPSPSYRRRSRLIPSKLEREAKVYVGGETLVRWSDMAVEPPSTIKLSVFQVVGSYIMQILVARNTVNILPIFNSPIFAWAFINLHTFQPKIQAPMVLKRDLSFSQSSYLSCFLFFFVFFFSMFLSWMIRC